MSYQVEFQDDGRIRVFCALGRGVYVSATADVNVLPEMLPAAIVEAIRERCSVLAEVWPEARAVKRVNGGGGA